MAYYEAQRCFQENLQLLGEPDGDALVWNLNRGLYDLTAALEADLQKIQTLLLQVLTRDRPR